MRRSGIVAACTVAIGLSGVFLGVPTGVLAASATYTVRAGDTLSSVALRLHVSLAALEQANGLSATAVLQVGQVLDLPQAAPPAATRAGYVVQGGDTLSSIAQSLGVSVAALEAANGLSPTSVLQVGQRLVVPGPQGAAAPATHGMRGGSVYVVQSGDTLSSIAARFGLSLARLYALNGLGPNSLLRIGQHLRLAAGARGGPVALHSGATGKAGPEGSYRVQAGDTLSSIASQLGVSLGRLYALNGLGPNSVLQVGEQLRVPVAAPARHVASPPSRPRAATDRASQHTAYTVQAGDTLSSIANRFGVSLATLQQLNPGVNPLAIQVGERILVPSASRSAAVAVQTVSLHSRVASEVQRFLGVPYVWGGSSPSGFDCSGLVQYVFGQLGISIPRDATSQYYAGQPVPPGALQPGDIVFFDTTGGISHDGIYIGNGQFVDAPTAGLNVEVENFYNSYWQSTYIGARWYGGN